MENLRIDLLYQGISDKLGTMHELLAKLGLTADQAGYMGDDIVDLHVMAACGFSAAPADCHEMVKPYARMVSSKIGGRGAVREVCEFILAAQGKLDAALAPYLPAPAK
jgi:3-deoxy-D-manno-octulosonate 8-phosphate phosphatase (KDO 8-P phosphatase)